ncbi:MAG: arginine--tRNA ligase, partial [Candidatus Thermoplasmatota archaeon]|nr:arginine--tRNA ligase [Candidatus Thermoplasmatota archaeon]
MRELFDPVVNGLAGVLIDLGLDAVEPKSIVGGATDRSHGDIAIPFHKFAGVLRRPPADIAEEAAGKLSPYLDQIAYVSSKSGFVNVTATPQWLSSRLVEFCAHPSFGVEGDSPRKVVVDYSSPNIAKEMHVGHLRSTVIGDSLVRILEAKGNKVIRENHIGDWGTPFGMLIERLEDLDSSGIVPDEALSDLGQFYRDARAQFDSDENFRARARARVVSLQTGDGPTLRRWGQLVDISMSHFQEVYVLLDVLLTEDDVMGESKYDHLLPDVVERLQKKGLLESNDGASVIYPGDWVNRDGDPLPLIIKKRDGGYNYATSDLACIIDRVERLQAEDLVYVVGAEQKQHFEMVFASARKSGLIDSRHTTNHVPFGLVLGPGGGKLKSRSGGAVKLLDLLNEAIDRASASVKGRNPDITQEELGRLSRSIGIGAVKYSDLKSDRTKDYVFDWEK